MTDKRAIEEAEGYLANCVEGVDDYEHELVGRLLDEYRVVSCENGVLWDTLEHIASMDSEKYILGNATSLAKFAVESRDARVSEGLKQE